MKIVIDILLLLDLIVGMCTVFAIIYYKYYKNEIRQINNIEHDQIPQIYILLPALREQRLVEETIKNFLQLNIPNVNFHIVIITTEKEEYEYAVLNKQEITTSSLVNQYLENNQCEIIEHYHYPKC